MSSVGHIAGYGMGAVDLVKVFGTTLGDTQFKKLTAIAALTILTTSAVTCWAVTERTMLPTRADLRNPERRFKVLQRIWSTLLNLPPRIQAICWAVFWSWIGWFPFLVYGSTWVGETYFRYDVPPEARHSKDTLGQMGRIGSTALSVYSSIIFVGAWLLPFLVKAPQEEDRFTPRPPARIAYIVERFNRLKPDLLTAWVWSNLMFSTAMFLTPFATSFRFATVLVAFCGLPWAINHWAPTAFLGMEVNRLAGASSQHPQLSTSSSLEMLSPRRRDGPLLEQGLDDDDKPASPRSPTSSTGELAGIYFGILNIYTTVPQFLGTVLSAVVFAALDPGKSPELAAEKGAEEIQEPDADGPNAIAVCLFIGAICTTLASYATRKLRDTT